MRSNIFISYSFTGREVGVRNLVESFNSAVFEIATHEILDQEHLEELEVIVNDHCMKRFGFSACNVTVLYFKIL